MSTDNKQNLQAYSGIPSSIEESMKMGDIFFQSGLFSDLKSAAQAVVKIQSGAEIGIPAFQALSNVHIIKGKPGIGAHLMAAKIKGSGKYKYKVVKHDDTICHIDFFERDGKDWEHIGDSVFTIADAKRAGSQNLDKFPRNMLFARAISNGLRWHCPDVFTGAVYVPEELEAADFVDSQKKERAQQLSPNNALDINILDPANEDDNKLFETFIALFDPEVMPAKLNDGKIDVAASKAVFETKYAEGKLLREEVSKWQPYMQKQFDHFKANPVQKEEQPEQQQNAEDFE